MERQKLLEQSERRKAYMENNKRKLNHYSVLKAGGAPDDDPELEHIKEREA